MRGSVDNAIGAVVGQALEPFHLSTLREENARLKAQLVDRDSRLEKSETHIKMLMVEKGTLASLCSQRADDYRVVVGINHQLTMKCRRLETTVCQYKDWWPRRTFRSAAALLIRVGRNPGRTSMQPLSS